MTDTEMLELAIGYRPDQIHGDGYWVMVNHDGAVCNFDYTDPETIWPIAEKYDAFPWRSLCADTMWTVSSLPK